MGIKTTGIFELLETSKDIEKRIDYWEKKEKIFLMKQMAW